MRHASSVQSHVTLRQLRKPLVPAAAWARAEWKHHRMPPQIFACGSRTVGSAVKTLLLSARSCERRTEGGSGVHGPVGDTGPLDSAQVHAAPARRALCFCA